VSQPVLKDDLQKAQVANAFRSGYSHGFRAALGVVRHLTEQKHIQRALPRAWVFYSLAVIPWSGSGGPLRVPGPGEEDSADDVRRVLSSEQRTE